MNVTRFLTIRIACACVIGALSLTVFAEEQSIAVVDMEVLIKAHADTAVAESVLKKQADEFEAERSGMLDDLDKLNAQFEAIREDAESGALSELGREQRKLEAQAIVVKVRELEKTLRDTTALRQNQLADRRKRMRDRIVEEINATISAYAKSRNFSVVLERHSKMGGVDMVLYASEAVDVTELLKRRIEQETTSP